MPTEITIMGYKFNELNEKAKQKVREWHAEGMHDWWDCTYDDAKTRGAEKGFDIEDIRFSGFWSQGDGAHWTGRINLHEFITANLDPEGAWIGEDVILLELLDDGWIDRYIVVHNPNFRYCHSGGMRLGDYPDNALESLDDDDDAVLAQGVMAGANVAQLRDSFDWQTRINEWCDEAIQQARSFADDIYKKLRDEYDELTSDECIAETCDANDWLFNEKGELL